jgi:hypothetical protein
MFAMTGVMDDMSRVTRAPGMEVATSSLAGRSWGIPQAQRVPRHGRVCYVSWLELKQWLAAVTRSLARTASTAETKISGSKALLPAPQPGCWLTHLLMSRAGSKGGQCRTIPFRAKSVWLSANGDRLLKCHQHSVVCIFFSLYGAESGFLRNCTATLSNGPHSLANHFLHSNDKRETNSSDLTRASHRDYCRLVPSTILPKPDKPRKSSLSSSRHKEKSMSRVSNACPPDKHEHHPTLCYVWVGVTPLPVGRKLPIHPFRK